MLNLTESTTNCPVPSIWKTHNKGKIYIYNKSWNKLLKILKNNKKFGIRKQQISKIIKINEKSLRNWSNKNIKPKIFTKEEFIFTNQNLYWLGLFYSDGHLRNNGSNHSYTYQTESSNIFQGYWYCQILQKFFQIFKHKEKDSITTLRNCNNILWTFKTNLSGISPIFIQLLKKGIINKKYDNKTSGYKKKLSNIFLKDTKNKENLFQGIFDGDGSIQMYNNSFIIDLALEPNTNIKGLIKQFQLTPTLAITNKRNGITYTPNLKNLYSIRLAPTSINKLNQNIYSEKETVNQLEFMLKAARYSIRPDKVYKLIKIINKICSKEYGENRNSIPIQREIRDLAN